MITVLILPWLGWALFIRFIQLLLRRWPAAVKKNSAALCERRLEPMQTESLTIYKKKLTMNESLIRRQPRQVEYNNN